MSLVKSPILTPAKLAANRSNACRSAGPLPHSRLGTTPGTGDEQTQTNPRGLIYLLSIRYGEEQQNKPKGTNRHAVNKLQPFLPRFRRKMNGTTNEAAMSFRIYKGGKTSLLQIRAGPSSARRESEVAPRFIGAVRSRMPPKQVAEKLSSRTGGHSLRLRAFARNRFAFPLFPFQAGTQR
jgi:hypothetical protein